MVHPDSSQLEAYVDGALSPEDRARLDTHLVQCEACSAIAAEHTRGMRGKQSKRSHQLPTVSDRIPLGRGGLFKGDVLGRYVLLDFLGAGGMGEVFVAYDPQLDRKVALKLLHGESMADQEARNRLLREAQAIARVSHPNVVAVHDVGLLGDRIFIAMEFIEGVSLRHFIRGKPPWAAVLAPMISAGRGLAAAHAVGLVHRDFKPENVLLGKDGRARVLDFGLARPPEVAVSPRKGPLSDSPVSDHGPTQRALLSTPLTEGGAVVGTPAYMAPEQHELKAIDGRTDQFGFCVALFEALYGTRPFKGATTTLLLASIAMREIQPLPSDNRVPRWLFDVVRRGLSYQSADRFPSMEALLSELERDRKQTRTRWVTAAALVAVGGVGAGVWFNRPPSPQCQPSLARYQQVWSPAASAKVSTSFRAAGLPFGEAALAHTLDALSGYGRQWATATDFACAATRVQRVASEEALARKTECLDARLEDVRQLVALLTTADRALVTNSIDAVGSLARPGPCASLGDESARAPDDWTFRERRSTLAKVKALYHSGRYPEALAQARSLARSVASSGVDAGRDRPVGATDPATRALEAEVHLYLARSAARAGQPGEATDAWLEAAIAAEAAADPTLAVSAWGELAAETSSRASLTSPFARLARAALERVAPPNPLVEARLSTHLGRVAAAEARTADAYRWQSRALELSEAVLGADHPDVGEAHALLGQALHGVGRTRESIPHYQRALEIATLSRGDSHPQVGQAENNLAFALMRLGRLEQAAVRYQHAVQIFSALTPDGPLAIGALERFGEVSLKLGEEETARKRLTYALKLKRQLYGDSHAALGTAWLVQVDLALADGKPALALEFAQRAHALHRRLLGESHPSLATSLSALGRAQLAKGDLKAARAAFEGAERLRLLTFRPDDPVNANSEYDLGQVLLVEGKAALAVERFTRALQLREPAYGADSGLVARDRVGLARAFLEAKDFRRAREQLERAVEGLESAEDPLSLCEARFWLARACWALGESVEARKRLEAARAAGRNRGSQGRRLLAQIDAWARTHRL